MKRLLLILLLFGAGVGVAATPQWMRYPVISPDGEQVVFSYKGDLWAVPTSGGSARQLTSHTAYDYAPVFSPDGKEIAFASDRNGNFDIYTLSMRGGEPRRVTTNSAGETPWSYSPNGEEILYSAVLQDPAASAQFPTASMSELYAVSHLGGRPRQVLATPAEEISFVGASGMFVYQDRKGGENIWRKHHTSSITRDLWLYDGAKHTRLTDFAGEDRQPRLSADGKTVYFLSERGGSFNVYEFPLDNPTQVKRITNHKTHPVRFLSVADNGTLCYAYDGDIYIKPTSGAARRLAVTIEGDNTAANRAILPVRMGSDAAVSEDGKQLAFIFRGEVFVTSTDYATTKQITRTAAAESDVVFSPDGRKVAYASERDGKWQIYTAVLERKEDVNFPNATLVKEEPLFKDNKFDRRAPIFSPDGKEVAFIENRDRLMVKNLATGKVRQITDGSQCYSTTGAFNYSWSPDGKWFAMSYTGNGHEPYTDIGIVSAAGGEPIHNLTNSGYTDSSPQWVLGGDAILFTSERYGMRNHASWGTLRDVMILFLNREAYDKFHLTKEERELQAEIEKLEKKEPAEEDKEAKQGDKEKKPAAKKPAEKQKDIVVELRNIEDRIVRLTPSSSQLGAATLDKEGKNLYYQAAYEGAMSLWQFDLEKKTPTKIGPASGQMVWDKKMTTLYILGPQAKKLKPATKRPEPITISAELVWDYAAERAYMFDHVYRQEKARFYNEKMHGVDWEMLRDAYQKFLPHINNNYDFAELLSEWLGELNVSHTGSGYRKAASPSGDATAQLGLLFDWNYAGDGLLVEEVVERGPFDRAASKMAAGAVVESIDGTPIKAGEDFYPLLNRKAGKRTLIRFRTADGEVIEEVVKPVTAGGMSDAMYKRWVKRAAAEVERLSGGRLGYVHIKSMGDPSFRTVYSDILGRYNHCEGIVIDTRFNGGGRLHEDVEVLFSGEKYLTQEIRGKNSCDMPSRRWNKASIMIMGEANYSNAHGTPWVYKFKEMGSLVGMPVPGTMTSVTWETLQDPTLYFGIPVVGYRTADGSYLENKQLEPDVKVANSKELIVEGRDEQLEAAVRQLLQEIDAAK
ncbi:MAG: S41 family peptidase [Rikenellaceae bacterium]|nr:S41 family peptidase [Rikenellaceae bacterium]